MSEHKPPDLILMDRKSAAKYIGFSPITLAQWASNKRFDLKPIKFGQRVRYLRSELDKFILDQMRP